MIKNPCGIDVCLFMADGVKDDLDSAKEMSKVCGAFCNFACINGCEDLEIWFKNLPFCEKSSFVKKPKLSVSVAVICLSFLGINWILTVSEAVENLSLIIERKSFCACVNLKYAVCADDNFPFCACEFNAKSEDDPFCSKHSRWTADLFLFESNTISIERTTIIVHADAIAAFFWLSDKVPRRLFILFIKFEKNVICI